MHNTESFNNNRFGNEKKGNILSSCESLSSIPGPGNYNVDFAKTQRSNISYT